MSADPLDFWTKTPSTTTVSLDPDVSYGRSENIRVKQNIGYIVCGIILRGSKDDAEVLLIQEVQEDWYLPAGRLEAGETIEDGMKREMKEEAGVECESLGLILVDHTRGAWYRFTYLAKLTGGTLKTPSQRDSESIQAAWFPVSQLLNGSLPAHTRLRSKDIIRLIRLAVERQFGAGGMVEQGTLGHARTIARPLVGLFARFVLVSDNKILLRHGRFPLVEHALMHHLAVVAIKFLGFLMDAIPKSIDFKVISLEALPVPAYEHDGSCLTLLIDLPAVTVKKQAREDGYEWIHMDSDKQFGDCVHFWRNNYAVLHL